MSIFHLNDALCFFVWTKQYGSDLGSRNYHVTSNLQRSWWELDGLAFAFRLPTSVDWIRYQHLSKAYLRQLYELNQTFVLPSNISKSRYLKPFLSTAIVIMEEKSKIPLKYNCSIYVQFNIDGRSVKHNWRKIIGNKKPVTLVYRQAGNNGFLSWGNLILFSPTFHKYVYIYVYIYINIYIYIYIHIYI